MPHKILIVDDHPMNITILKKILDHDDYHVATAASGEEALARMQTFQPDLILLDVMMPGIDGYETCRRIRAASALRHTRIIMVSAKARLEDRQQGYAVGADDYVTKPFTKHELLAKVRHCLELQAPLSPTHQASADPCR
jgi:CheY-like chemotaxis protein